MSRWIAASADAAARHPRHLLLGGLVAGLLAGPLVAGTLPALAVCAVLAALVGAPRVLAWARGAPCSAAVAALGCALAAIGGAYGAQARLHALDRTALTPLIGHVVEAEAVLLEPPQERSWGATVAVARLGPDGPGAGERVLLRAAAHGGVRARWPGSPTGAIVRVRGRVRALGPADDFERVRGAHAQIAVESVVPTGRRRGGIAGALDGVRRRAEGALSRALPADEAALARGMVLGQDDALTDEVREDFRASGLAHLLAASGTNVALLAALVVVGAMAAGLGLTGRMLLALAAIAAYVPLPAAGRRSSAPASWGRPACWRCSRDGRRRAGTRCSLPRRRRSRSTRARWPTSVALSFAAVVALLAIGPGLRREPAPGRPLAARGGIGPDRGGDDRDGSTASPCTSAASRSSPWGANLLAAPVVAPSCGSARWLRWSGRRCRLAAVPPALTGPPLGYLGWPRVRRRGCRAAEAAIAIAPLAAVVAYAGAGSALLALRLGARTGARPDGVQRRRRAPGGPAAARPARGRGAGGVAAPAARRRRPGLVVSFPRHRPG